ncbi:MAG TPA: hypothetical protein VKE27_04275, partial [Candidatus Dormibacteraeota bacterium]|nr:hypothetical protein [Candidatus Dormibacteraeota bacterium]
MARGIARSRGRPAAREGRHIVRQPLHGRPWSWITGRPRLTDGLIVAFNLLAGLAPLVSQISTQRWLTLGALAALAIVQGAALWWRRRYPVLVLATVILAQALTVIISQPREASGIGLVFAVYAVSVYDQSSVRLVVGGAAIVDIALAVLLLVFGDLDAARIFIPVG